MTDKIIMPEQKLVTSEGFVVSLPTKNVTTTMPVGTITLTDRVGDVTYTPQKDITTYELAMITRLFFRLSLGNPHGATPDWRGYLEEHKLSRHFTDPTKEAKS